jgi:hypothetical protein
MKRGDDRDVARVAGVLARFQRTSTPVRTTKGRYEPVTGPADRFPSEPAEQKPTWVPFDRSVPT